MSKKQKFSPKLRELLYSGSMPERSANLQSKNVTFGFSDGNNIDNVKPIKEAEKELAKKRKKPMVGIC